MAWKPWHKEGRRRSTGERCAAYAYNDETDKIKVSVQTGTDERDEIISISDFEALATPPPTHR